MLLPVAAVETLTMPDMKTRNIHEVTTKTRAKQLSFRFEKPGEDHEITLMYFRPGVRWIPTYRIDLPKDGGNMAEISMQAEVLNEAEDLVDAPFDIVVGVPNFRFKTTPSPLALEGVMRDALAQAEPTLMGQMRNDLTQTQFRSRAGEVYGRENAAGGEGAELIGGAEGAGAHDLYVYSLPELRLRKGDRAAVTIFKASVPYRDVYTWDLRLTRTDISKAPAGVGVGSPLGATKNEVWHQIELNNTTQVRGRRALF